MLALLCWAIGVRNIAAHPARAGNHSLAQTRSSWLLPASFTLFNYGNTPNHRMLYFPQICNHSRGYLYIYRKNQLISVNIFTVCRRRQNKTTSGNPAFFIFFCLEGIYRSRLGILLRQVHRQTPRPTPPLLAHRSRPGRHRGHAPDQGYIFFFFLYS